MIFILSQKFTPTHPAHLQVILGDLFHRSHDMSSFSSTINLNQTAVAAPARNPLSFQPSSISAHGGASIGCNIQTLLKSVHKKCLLKKKMRQK
jgi:hypothetical protein